MIIKDNFLDPLFVDILLERTLKGNMYYNGVSNSLDGLKFFQAPINLENVYAEYLCRKFIELSDKKLGFLRAYANIQFENMDGDWHEDDGEYTFLLMISETLKPGDGCFETKNKKVDFVKNRCIMFDARETHRGLSSKLSKQPRVTLAFKSKEYNANRKITDTTTNRG